MFTSRSTSATEQSVSRRSLRPAHETLCHPVALAALALWILNDHVFKAAYPGVVTGKLSDVTGLVVFPLLVVASWELVLRWSGRPAPPARSLALTSAVAALSMVLINCSPPASTLYCHLLGVVQWPALACADLISGSPTRPPTPVTMTMDPTDAWTVPAAFLPLLLRRVGRVAEVRLDSLR